MLDIHTATPVSVETARDYINNLDLDYIVDDMCSARYPLPRWTVTDAKHCCLLYKRFLILLQKHLPELLVPTREIDEFWHNHILYTKQYTRDCLAVFGHYLHHEPASETQDDQHLIDGFLVTKQYYFAEFGESLQTFPITAL
jgi:hypothetical protein